MYDVNKQAGWNLDVTSAEDMQITRYKKGGFYLAFFIITNRYTLILHKCIGIN